MKNIKKISYKSPYWTVALFYALIAFEFFYMATPFAVYFYGVYKPFLGFLDKFPSVSWITGFFLPHLAEDTKSPIINSLKTTGVIIASAGLLTFLICAFQVYYAKILKKGMVNGGLYKYIRHPQYTAFAVCSFGLLLLWPRYLVLIMFITMLFAYYLLAKAEESECENRFGEGYLQYKKNTYMFLPVKFHITYSRIPKTTLIVGIYVLSLTAALQTAKLIKKASISSLYSGYEKNTVYLSIYKMPETEMDGIISALNKNREIRNALEKYNNENARFINYILPADMYISEIPMMKPENALCHVYTSSYSDIYKIVYTTAKFPVPFKSEGKKDVLFNTAGLNPVIEVRYDKNSNRISDVLLLPAAVSRYENTPEPVF